MTTITAYNPIKRSERGYQKASRSNLEKELDGTRIVKEQGGGERINRPFTSQGSPEAPQELVAFYRFPICRGSVRSTHTHGEHRDNHHFLMN